MTKKTLFYAFSLLIKQLFSQLLNKAIVMALWTKVSLCAKACPERSRMGSLLEQSLPRTPSRPKTSIISVNPVILSNLSSCSNVFVAKNPFNQRNPRLINDLRAFGIFTLVKMSLQIKLFLQNKANFRKSQMNVTSLITADYDKRTLGQRGKKQSQTKPIKANLLNAKTNVTSYITTNYENKTPIRAPKKQSQISKRQKTIQTSLPQGIMKKTAISASGKTNPNKPNQTQCLSAISVAGHTAHLLIDRAKSKFLNFHPKNSLTVRPDSLEYWVFDGR